MKIIIESIQKGELHVLTKEEAQKCKEKSSNKTLYVYKTKGVFRCEFSIYFEIGRGGIGGVGDNIDNDDLLLRYLSREEQCEQSEQRKQHELNDNDNISREINEEINVNEVNKEINIDKNALRTKRYAIAIKEGFLTDGSTFTPDVGISWLFHDYLYSTHCLPCESSNEPCSREIADAIMHAVAEHEYCKTRSKLHEIFAWGIKFISQTNPFYLLSKAWVSSGKRGPEYYLDD